MAGSVAHDDVAVHDARAGQNTSTGHRHGSGELSVDRQVALVDEGSATDLAAAGQRDAPRSEFAQGAGADDITFKGQGIALGTSIAAPVKAKLPACQVDVDRCVQGTVQASGPELEDAILDPDRAFESIRRTQRQHARPALGDARPDDGTREP